MVLTSERHRPAGRELRLKPRLVPPPSDVRRKRSDVDFAKELLGCVRDCHVVIAGWTSRSLHSAMAASGKQFVLTDLFYVDDVQDALARGKLDDHAERVR